MASESVLQQLFQASKASSSFKGMSEEDIWKACLKYKEKPDEIINNAISILHQRDEKEAQKDKMGQEKLEKGKAKMIELHKQEASDRIEDAKNAEEILEELFKS